jgi:hypothetical protein
MIHQNCRRPNLEKFLPTYLQTDESPLVGCLYGIGSGVLQESQKALPPPFVLIISCLCELDNPTL